MPKRITMTHLVTALLLVALAIGAITFAVEQAAR